MGAALPPPARDEYGLGYEKNDRNKKRKKQAFVCKRVTL